MGSIFRLCIVREFLSRFSQKVSSEDKGFGYFWFCILTHPHTSTPLKQVQLRSPLHLKAQVSKHTSPTSSLTETLKLFSEDFKTSDCHYFCSNSL